MSTRALVLSVLVAAAVGLGAGYVVQSRQLEMFRLGVNVQRTNREEVQSVRYLALTHSVIGGVVLGAMTLGLSLSLSRR